MNGKISRAIYVIAALALVLAPLGCGGGGGSDAGGENPVYNGSTTPATADSTTSTTLVEYSLGVVEAGNPLASAFMGDSESLPPQAPIAVPQIGPTATTTVSVTMAQIRQQDPGAGVINGTDYDPVAGSGTMTLASSAVVTLHLETYELTPGPDTVWNIDYAEYNGDIVFDGFTNGDQPTITGTVTMAPAEFTFTNPAGFSLTSGFSDDPGLPMWSYAAMTFDSIAVEEFDSWTLGEGDWEMYIDPGSFMYIDVNSMTVLYQGSTYKLEDAGLAVTVYPGLGTAYEIYGSETSGNDFATFYHPELGKIWFEGMVGVGEATGEIEDGGLSFYDGPVDLPAGYLLDVNFTWDDAYDSGAGATAYWIYVWSEDHDEFGYILDGEYTPDPSAASNFLI